MQATDLEQLVTLGRPAGDQARRRVVVSASRPDLDADANVGQLWSVPLDGGAPRRITRGFRDSTPKLSPDGSAIAFLRSSNGAVAQVYLVAADGGEAVQVTDAKLGVEDFAWSPDAQRLAFTAEVPEQGRYGTVDGIAPSAEPPRRITQVRYKENARGYIGDRRSHVFVVDVPALDGEPVYPSAPRPDGSVPDTSSVPAAMQLTDGPWDDRQPVFLPDGDQLAFTSAGRDGTVDLRAQIWAVPVGGGEARPLTPVDSTLEVDRFAFAPDGTLLFTAQDLGPSGVDFVGKASVLYRMGDGVPSLVDGAGERDFTAYDLDVLPDGTARTQDRSRGACLLVDIAPDGTVVEHTGHDLEVVGSTMVGDDIVVSYQSATTAGDLGIVRSGVVEPITDFSAGLRATGIVVPESLEVTMADGHVVHGWVARPDGDGPHPTLLLIHGGPFAQYTVNLFDEVQVYVDAGYAVVFCNPRGSAGYGIDHGRAIKGAMGTVDFSDVLEFLEGALQRYDELDADRMGVLGGSYGGYLTAWIIAHDHPFRTAVVERGYVGLEAFVGSSDIGWFFGQEYHQGAARAQSPQELAANVRTPTLVIHSEDDLRTPLGQAETYWATLKLQGVETELLIFPGENHELSRSGRPRHRVQRFEAILDWLGRYL